MTSPSSERTLISALIPSGVSHTNALYSIATEREVSAVDLVGLTSAVPIDFLGRVSGVTNFQPAVLLQLPIMTPTPENDALIHAIRIRALGLNCLTDSYSNLWREVTTLQSGEIGATALQLFQEDEWTAHRHGIRRTYFRNLSQNWERTSALRNHREASTSTD